MAQLTSGGGVTVETIRYGLIGQQDLRWGSGTFEVTLADGRVVVLNEVRVILVSPNGTQYVLGVDNDGTLTVSAA